MPNTTPLTDAINALTTYANETTGASDTTLSAAVGSLAAGYGGGGGGSSDVIDFLVTGVGDDDYVFTQSSIHRGAFAFTTGTFTLTFSNVTSITATYLFEQCGASKINMPLLQSISGGNSFRESKETSLFFPSLTSVSGPTVFYNNPNLKTVVFPALTTASNGATYQIFNGCTNLEAVDIGGVVDKMDNWFQSNCEKMATMVLRGNGVSTLYNTTALDGTPFKSGGTGGTLYVPNDLISSYQANSNWNTVMSRSNNSIVAIENSQYENYYVDGTPIS